MADRSRTWSGRSGSRGLVADLVPVEVEALVIDASAIVRGALVDQLTGLSAYALQAPSLLWSEVASALSQLRYRAEISDDEATRALDRILAHPIAIHSSRDIVASAIALARQLGWAKTYDAEYLALAQQLNVRLLTNDAGLHRFAIANTRIVGPAELLDG